MSKLVVNERGQIAHSEEIQDIIFAPPSWLLQWGITIFFFLLVVFILLAALIKYPNIVKTQLTIKAYNAPKAVVSKVSGKIIQILIHEGDYVGQGRHLAYLESTADHNDVLTLFKELKALRDDLMHHSPLTTNIVHLPISFKLGELQTSYQTFVQNLITYKASVESGIWMKKRSFLIRDLESLNTLKTQLEIQKRLQNNDLNLATEDFKMHQKLAQEKAETPTELRDAESRFLAKQSPLIQTDAALIAAANNIANKQKETLELENQVNEERAKFNEALNSLISQVEEWMNKYILSASQSGKVSFVTAIQPNKVIQAGQDIFFISATKNSFYGEMIIPQTNLGKVQIRQQVLVKLRSYPFEEYGILRGKVTIIDEALYKDSVFFSKVTFDKNQYQRLKLPIRLKQGMLADAEVITEKASLLQRVSRNIIKMLN